MGRPLGILRATVSLMVFNNLEPRWKSNRYIKLLYFYIYYIIIYTGVFDNDM